MIEGAQFHNGALRYVALGISLTRIGKTLNRITIARCVALAGAVWVATAVAALPEGAQAAAPGGSPQQPIIIHVTPGPGSGGKATTGTAAARRGNTEAAGDRPNVRTLAQAVKLARELRAGAKRRAVVIQLSPGTHRLRQPVALTAADSGSLGAPLIIQGAGPSATRLSGGLVLRRLGIAADLMPGASLWHRLPVRARRRVQVFEIPGSINPTASVDVARVHNQPTPPIPFEVFDDSGPLRPARWPNSGWAKGAKVKGSGTRIAIDIDAKRAARWRNEPDLWVGGYFRWDWSYETQPARAVPSPPDRQSLLQLAKPPLYGIASQFRAFIYHAASELDEAGEWILDRAAKRLLVWPRETAKGSARIEISAAASLVTITGANYVQIKDMTLELTRGDAVTVNGAGNVDLSNLVIRRVAGRAVVFKDTRNSGIRSSVIEDTGDGAVVLSGGTRTSLSPALLYADNNIIRRFARLGRTYRPAVLMSGVGNRVVGNFIADAPHSAVIFSGNDHLIGLNEITRVVTETDDAGAIYMGRDWTARGTRIVNNFIHDLNRGASEGTKGIMLDDFASGISIEKNLFLRVHQPVFIGGGRDNRVAGNLFLNSEPAIHIDSRGTTWAARHINDAKGELRNRLAAMPIHSDLWRQRYPNLANILHDAPERAKYNWTKGNYVVGGRRLRLTPEVDAKEQMIDPYMRRPPVKQRPSEAVRKRQSARLKKLDTATSVARFLAVKKNVPRVDGLPSARMLNSMDRLQVLRRGLTPTIRSFNAVAHPHKPSSRRRSGPR